MGTQVRFIKAETVSEPRHENEEELNRSKIKFSNSFSKSISSRMYYATLSPASPIRCIDRLTCNQWISLHGNRCDSSFRCTIVLRDEYVFVSLRNERSSGQRVTLVVAAEVAAAIFFKLLIDETFSFK